MRKRYRRDIPQNYMHTSSIRFQVISTSLSHNETRCSISSVFVEEMHGCAYPYVLEHWKDK